VTSTASLRRASRAGAPTRASRRGRTFGQKVVVLGYLAPSLIAVAGSLVFALMLLGGVSLRDASLGKLSAIFQASLTFDNYAEVLGDPETWSSFGISILYVIGSTSLPFIAGLLMALLLNQKMPGRRILRTLALVPWAVPGITATIAFVWMLQPTYGVWNYILRSLGLIDSDVNWFGDPALALIAVILPTTWKAIPYFTLMLLAGLQAIPRDLYEAAEVDGAGRVARLRWVTLPGLAPFILVSLIFSSMHSFREFDFIYGSTQGGPDGATETVAVRVFNLAFNEFDLGNAATLGVVTFVLVGVLVAILLRRNYKGSLEGFL
jgi:multiple sugar transport system permease protein